MNRLYLRKCGIKFKRKGHVKEKEAYIRVSTAMQVDGYSLEAQNGRLTKFENYVMYYGG